MFIGGKASMALLNKDGPISTTSEVVLRLGVVTGFAKSRLGIQCVGEDDAGKWLRLWKIGDSSQGQPERDGRS